ncbi:MAG TPA: PD-(D/E)XK nuclease family protein, partial [Coriobacteriia bacterium]|nr:PD-(D/E)XK nuclease family protein [Coriobacteriia bacterium]
MALTLVTGRPNAGKTGRLHGFLESAAANGEAVLALPSMPDAQRAADEFAIRGVAGVRTCVLDRWIADLWALYGDGTRIVTPPVRAVLVREACSRERFRALASSATTPGFANMVAEIAERVPDPGQARPRTAEEHELVAALSRYGRLLQREGLVESSRVALSLGEAPPPVTGPIALNRFTDLSPAQETFVIGLASVADVMVSLPWEDGFAATEALTPLVRRFASAGAHEHVRSGEPGGELQLLEGGLFRAARSIEPTGAVVFVEAPNADLESALAVDLAARAIAEGVPPDRIAIAFRDAAPRVPLVAAAARRAGIALDADVALPLSELPMGRSLLALLDSVTGSDGSRERLAAYLHSPYSGFAPSELERPDAGWRRRRTTGDRLLSEAASAGGSRAIGLARAACSARLTARTVRKWQRLLDEMLVSSWRGHEAAYERSDAVVHREALRTLSSLADGLGRGVPAAEVRTALARTRVTLGGGERQGAVVLTEAHRIRSRRFDVVILGGLAGAEFSPEAARSAQRGLLERLGVSGGADEREAERLLFYIVATRPRKRLYLLRHASDQAGQPVAASSLWHDALDLYRGVGGPDGEDRVTGAPAIVVDASAVARSGIAYTPGGREARAVERGTAGYPSRGALCSPAVKRALADREEFGVGELEVYSCCPYRWFFEHELRPREIEAAFEPRHAGSLAHAALARFYARWSPQDAPRRVTPETLGEAITCGEEAVDEVLAEWPAALDLAERLATDRVRRWVIDTIRDDALVMPGYLPVAHEFAFGRREGRPFCFGGVFVRGRVDRIDALGESLVVTDYKSSADIHGHRSFATKKTMQLPVYLSAVAAHLGGDGHGAVFRSLRARTARGFWRGDRVSFESCGVGVDAVDA